MNAPFNPNFLLLKTVDVPQATMGLSTEDIADMERRRKACKFGRTKSGRCRKKHR